MGLKWVCDRETASPSTWTRGTTTAQLGRFTAGMNFEAETQQDWTPRSWSVEAVERVHKESDYNELDLVRVKKRTRRQAHVDGCKRSATDWEVVEGDEVPASSHERALHAAD